MLQINLLPVREARRKADVRQMLMQLLLGVIVAAGAVAVVHSRMADQISSSEERIAQMQSDIDRYKPQLDQVARFRKQKKQLEQKIGTIDKLDRARTGPLMMMAEIASRIPKRLWLTSLKTDGRTIVLKGESLDNEIVAVFLRELGASRYFANVDLDSTQLGGERGGLKLVSFNIRAVLVNPKPGKKKA